MTNNAKAYYQSHRKLEFIGDGGQVKLNAAKVLVIGAGGLGCPCLLALAGCGVGTLGIADFDTIAVSNLHRQTLYEFDDVGKAKATVAKQRLQLHNPYINIIEHFLLVNDSNVLELIAQYDVVVDGTDNFAVRYLINDACVYLNKPLVYGAIYQTEGHVTVFNYRDGATLRCLFPEPDVETYVPSCAEVGAYTITTSIIGTMMANEVVKVILQQTSVLVNKLLIYDALSAEARTLGYKAKPQSREKSISRFEQGNVETDISPEDFLKLTAESYQLIDVREDWEHDEFNIGGVNVPLAKFKRYDLSGFSPADKIITYCLQGARSQSAAQYLRENGFKNTVSLRGGLNAYLKVSI